MERHTQLSVNIFLHYNDEYLFLRRSDDKKLDPGKYNSVGGKVEPGETFAQAALRETKEETGYVLSPEQLIFSGLVHLTEGYEDDWVMCFFKAEVSTKEVPIGIETEDGQLFWISKDEALRKEIDLVDDLNYSLDYVLADQPFFMNATVNDSLLVEKHTVTVLGK